MLQSNIVLIGMPGCGKSTVGIVLAKMCGKKFLDTDLVIQERENCLLQEIIDKKGLDSFFEAEEQALLSVNVQNSVIATGGSAVFSQKGMEHLKKNALCVYIDLPVDILEKRLSNLSTRGVAGADTMTVAQIYGQRAPLYKKYADIVCDFSGHTDAHTSAREILRLAGLKQ